MGVFSDGVRRSVAQAKREIDTAFVNAASHALVSIQSGSPVTGAPGQPVGQYGPGYNQGSVGGTLKASWQLEFDSPTSARISTNIVYARGIEDGVGPHGPITLRSTVGGFHSVKLTVAGFSKILMVEMAKARE